MPRARRYARIAITLPQQDLAAADRLARAHDRSRSWIMAEAIRRFAASSQAPPDRAGSGPRLRDGAAASASPSQSGLGASRLAQLTRDLSLTPEARVREAEETLRLTEPRGKPRVHRVLAFDRYEDFLHWRRARDLPR